MPIFSRPSGVEHDGYSENAGPCTETSGVFASLPCISAGRRALDAAWKLSKKPGFVESFRSAVSKLTNTDQRSSIYAESLNKLVFNLLDTATDSRVRAGLQVEEQDVQDQASAGYAPSYSFRNEPNVWIRKSAFDAGVNQLTACIFHEAAHVAGAPGDPIAEIALDTIHNAAGLKR